MAKVKMSITMDKENVKLLTDAAWTLRTSKSALLNKYLTEGLERDSLNGKKTMSRKDGK